MLTPWAIQARPDEWLLAREFHFGQEETASTRVTSLQSQAGDTDAGLTQTIDEQFPTLANRLSVDLHQTFLTHRRSPDTES